MDVRAAIIDRLRLLAQMRDLSEPTGMYSIGVPLIGAGHDQHDIVNALYYLQRDGMIEILAEKALRVIKPL